MHKFVIMVKGELVTYNNYDDIPDDFDPRPGFVEQLKQEKEKLRAEFSKRVMEIDEKINSLLAITA